MIVLVTVKLPRNPAHDPRNKVTGACPVTGNLCTDATGEHHTVAVIAPCDDRDDAVAYAVEKVRDTRPGVHVTRSETVAAWW